MFFHYFYPPESVTWEILLWCTALHTALSFPSLSQSNGTAALHHRRDIRRALQVKYNQYNFTITNRCYSMLRRGLFNTFRTVYRGARRMKNDFFSSSKIPNVSMQSALRFVIRNSLARANSSRRNLSRMR